MNASRDDAAQDVRLTRCYMRAVRAGDDARSALSGIIHLRLDGVEVTLAEQQADALAETLAGIANALRDQMVMTGVVTESYTAADLEADMLDNGDF